MVQVVTVATHECDGLKRFLQSCPDAIVLGIDSRRKFNMNYPGGGFKVNLFKTFLDSCSNEQEVILFTDSFDAVILNKNIRVIPGKVVFSAETSCWPDRSLEKDYPPSPTPFRFLNSGGFIGTVKMLKRIMEFATVKDTDDDQLFYTRAFLSERYNIVLDVNCRIFQTFSGAESYLKVSTDEGFRNIFCDTRPVILHGNGCNKTFFNRVCDYVLPKKEDSRVFELPSILVAFDAPECVVSFKYAAKFLTLTFIDKAVVSSTDLLLPHISIEENRQRAVQLAKKLEFDAIMFVGANARLSNSSTLTNLCVCEKDIVAPMLVRPNSLFSNFWTDFDERGYYRRGFDYLDILNKTLTGTWNVPYIMETFLVRKAMFDTMDSAYSRRDDVDRDMRVCKYIRDKGIFMYVNNTCTYGTVA